MTDHVAPEQIRVDPQVDEVARMWGAGWRRYFFPAFWLVYLGQTVDGVSKRRWPAGRRR